MSETNTKHSDVVERTFRLAENIAPQIQDAVVPVWCNNRDGLRRQVGTAFFAEWAGRSFVVTALHIFELNPEEDLKIEFFGTVLILNAMSACTSSVDDLWLAETSFELHKSLQSIKVPLLLRDDPDRCRFGTGALLFGYPEDLNPQGKPFKPIVISTTLETRGLISKNTMPEPLYYSVDDEHLTTAGGAFVMDRPGIFGMSGGPVFGWYFTEVKAQNYGIVRYYLQGMIQSWQQKDGYVVACNAARIFSLVEASLAGHPKDRKSHGC